jgi:signal transduction histidine kinase
MASSRSKISLINFHKELKATQKKIDQSMAKLQRDARQAGNPVLQKNSARDRDQIKKLFTRLDATIRSAETKLIKTVAKKTESLERKVQRARQLKAKVDANNMLLEIKRKDLLGQSADIEAAYEKISIRNSELTVQKQEIDIQTEKLRERNEELQSRTESLLDQTDYLHEANETITNMHQELAQQKDEIERKNEELLTLNNEKNNLIGIVAHDLKSPLNQSKGLVSLVRVTAKLEGEAADCLAMIESSALRLSSMIAKILDIEAIESRQLNLKMERTNLSEILSGLEIRFKLDAIQKHIELQSAIPPEVYIDIDKNYLTQILENLLSNAIKFSPLNKNVYLELIENERDVVIVVKDEGPGLTEDDKKKLFSKYQKLSAKPTGSESSTGLGLSIVKKFVESMHGQIWCESEAGQGARFLVKFSKSHAA